MSYPYNYNPSPSQPPYGAPQQPYGGAQLSYGGPTPQSQYGGARPTSTYGQSVQPTPNYGQSGPPSSNYGQSGPPTPNYGQSGPPTPNYGQVPPTSTYGQSGPPTSTYGQPSAPYGGGYPPQSNSSPFATLVPSAFPPGSDPNLIACFQIADRDRSGFIDDKELQSALSSYNESFGMRTVHLLMYTFTNTNARIIGPKEFTSLFYSLQNWRSIFERFDRDKSGRIDASELREALLSLGFSASPGILDLLVSKFDKSGGRNKTLEYDNFIECCLTVKGLTEKFKEKDTSYTGSASFTYEAFMMTVLPFLIA